MPVCATMCLCVCVCVCVFITAVPITKLFARVGGGKVEDMCYDEPRPVWTSVCVFSVCCVCVYYCRTYFSVCLLLQYLFYLCAVDAHHIYSDVCVYYFIAFWGIVRKH